MSTTEREKRYKSSKHKDRDKEKDKHRSRDKEREKDRDRDPDRKHKRRKHEDDYEGSSRKHKHRRKDKGGKEGQVIVDDDMIDDGMWVEKNIDMDGERVLATDIPTAESLKITSAAEERASDPNLPPFTKSGTKLERDEWMLLPPSILSVPSSTSASKRLAANNDKSLTEGYGEPSSNARTMGGGVDFFSSLGTEHKKKKPEKPNPEEPKISSRELNPDLRPGKPMDLDEPPPPLKSITPGGPGSSWRMMRLRRVYETAEEESRPIEEVAIERFGSLEQFEEAKEERRILDERVGKKADRDRERGRKEKVPLNRRLDSLRLPSQVNSPLAQSHTPIPSVMTPPPALASGSKGRALSPSSLNKLQAKVLRAKLMGALDAEKLEKEYEEELRKAHGGGDADGDSGVRMKVEVLPTLDVRGKLYDIGHGKEDDRPQPGNRIKKEEKFETHDRKTGDIIRYNADDDEMTLGELLRQERFGAGMSDQKNLDAQFAKAIMGDGKFENDLEYMDDNAAKLGRQKMRSDAMKRQFAIHDYKRTQQVLASCPFCYGEDDSLPKAPIVAMGTRAYLSCTTYEELVKDHCLIVPIQHHLNMLEADDDTWDEVKNFMKCLMRMFAEESRGVIFYETVISLKWQKHTFIECVPLPWDQFDLIPGYFKESILTSEAEWSQHKKLIDFSSRSGGFRRAMVPNLPYFMVQFDYKGEKGYGHVIEGTGKDMDEDMDEGEKGGGEFPRYFAGEIIGNVLDIEPRRWRHPRKLDFRSHKERVKDFKKKYDRFDWTGMIEQ
ncbi:Pre-mRNA-splicing factor cwf19 [Leucoagaricus sp. SymC.cos]|nr:Pre-mRNA-splicing factor cwf19 [Leucoagaricus sp. SymC.cos]